MDYCTFKEKTKKWNQLSQIDILGSYDFYTSIVALDALTSKKISNANVQIFLSQKNKLRIDQYENLKSTYSLAAHEYTHFIDATSTLWGLNHLKKMNDAYLSGLPRPDAENHFYKAKQFHDHIKRIRLPKYYNEISPNKEKTQNWQFQLSIGHLFSSGGTTTKKPVLFARFSNEKNEMLARSPISLIALLECSAMAQEVMIDLSLISKLEEDSKIVEANIYKNKMLEYLYNQEITEYSVCVHLVSNILKCKEIFASFSICAILSRICLNCPEPVLRRVSNKVNIGEVLGINPRHESIARIKHGLNSGDRGILFLLLAYCLPKNSAEGEIEAKSGAVLALNKLGLTNKNIEEISIKEANTLHQELVKSPIQSIVKIAESGFENFTKINTFEPNINFQSLNLPPALLGDSSQWLPFPGNANKLKEFNLDTCFDELYTGQEWVDRFSEACI